LAREGRGLDLQRVFELARPEVPLLVVASIALIFSASMVLLYPMAAGWMVDAVDEGSDLSQVNLIAGGLVVVFLVQAIFGAARSWLFTLAGERVVARLRKDLFARVLNQDVGFFDTSRTGELLNRLAADTTVLQNTVTVNVSMLLRFGVMLIGGVGMLTWMSPQLTLIAMAVVPVVAAAASLLGRSIRALSKRAQDAAAEATQVAEEVIGGVRTVRAFAREPAEVERYGTAVWRSYSLAAKRAAAMASFGAVATFAGYSSVALVAWWGGRMVVADTLTIGALTSFLIYTLMIAGSVAALSGLYSDFMKASGASNRVFDLIDHIAEIEDGGGEPLASVQGDVAFEGVHFTYPSRPDVPVLVDFELHFAQGETVALVGPSGSGKSTVAALLSRFYDPQQGVVRVDGRDIRELEPRSLRRQVGVVAQEPVLFATSIRENIRYGKPDATEEEVREAAVAANALDFVEGFPEGFDTAVGERGVRLSGGQKQRIAIARALVQDPRILVLDEATSALDAESEHLVQEALDRLMIGRTTLVIAHRLSTVMGADRVAVLDQGAVVEQGPHAELLARDGLYRKLVERQFGGLDPGRSIDTAVALVT
jgi:ATP-binding cassette subfamily B protein